MIEKEDKLIIFYTFLDKLRKISIFVTIYISNCFYLKLLKFDIYKELA